MVENSLSLYERAEPERTRVSVVSIPLELGSDARGLAQAPRALYDAGLTRMLSACGMELGEEVEVPCPAPRHGALGPLKHLDEVVAVAQHSSAAVERLARKGDLVLALGGDHATVFGTVAGAARTSRSLGLIWIDAHPDAHTHETTLSGNLHGMGAAALLGLGHEALTGIAGSEPAIAPEHLLYLGLKDMDPAEIALLKAERVRAVTMFDIAERGLARAIAAIDALRQSVSEVWVSMDIDSIERVAAPGVGMPSEGGLTRREALALARYIGRTCRLVGLDVVELLPANDVGGTTSRLALELIAQFVGGEFGDYSAYMEGYEALPVGAAAIDKNA